MAVQTTILGALVPEDSLKFFSHIDRFWIHRWLDDYCRVVSREDTKFR